MGRAAGFTMVVDCNVRLAFNSSEPFDLAQGERPRNSVRGEPVEP